MDVETAADLGLVRKRARTATERERLGREAAMLRVVAHPGVVQLVDVEGSDPPDVLVLRHVNGGNLIALGDQPAAVVAGLGAALATTIADLHDVGVSHGAIEAEHILLDEEGRPVLCSFGRATRTALAAEAEICRRDDIRNLARLLLDRLPAGFPPRAIRTLRQAASPRRQSRCRSARWLARQLVAAVPAARLPDLSDTGTDDLMKQSSGLVTGQTHGRTSGPRSALPHLRWPWVALITLCVVGATAIVLAMRWSTPTTNPRPAPGIGPTSAVTSLTGCPPVDQRCEPVPTPGGILTTPSGSFQLASPGEVVVVGRWQCAATALPAVLRPATGEVWTFDAWPPANRSEAGRLVAQIPSARSLEVRPGPSGCDVLEVERQGLPPVKINPTDP